MLARDPLVLWFTVGPAILMATVLSVIAVRLAPSRLRLQNHAGRRVPAVLGLGLVAGSMPPTIWPAVTVFPPGGDNLLAAPVIVTLALLGVGLLDDLVEDGPRGFRAHVSSLARGRPTTGILKLAVGAAGSGWVALQGPWSTTGTVAVALLLAVSTNVWNVLDVAPGRALKWALVVILPLWLIPRPFDHRGLVVASVTGAVLALLVWDLREWGMLGDAGSNPLGFLVGYSLVSMLPEAAIYVALGVALALQVAAETVTISRLIDAVPPLRWFDRLGRIRR